MKKLRQRLNHLACTGVAVLLFAARTGHAQTIVLDAGVGPQVDTNSLVTYFAHPGIDIAEWSYAGGALVKIDANGQRTILTDFRTAQQEDLIPYGYGLADVAWISSATPDHKPKILALDSGTSGFGALFAIDPSTGKPGTLSNFFSWTYGPVGKKPTGMVVVNRALNNGSDIYVVDSYAGTHGHGVLFKIDPETGIRAVFSDFGKLSQGPIATNPVSVTAAPAGVMGVNPVLLVLNKGAGIQGVDGIFAVDENGNRTILSNLGNPSQGPVCMAPQKIIVVPGLQGLGASIYLTDSEAGSNSLGALFRINPADGSRTIVSDFGNANQGPLGNNITGLAFGGMASGNVLVTDKYIGSSPTQSKIFSVALSTGQRTVVVDCSNTALGPCNQPIGVLPLQ